MEPQNKDQLIYEEIIQKGYQQEMFNVFLKAKKGPQGTDLSIWSYEELQNAINEFLQNNPNLQSQEINPQILQTENSELQSQRLNTNFVQMEEEINCNSPDKTDLSDIQDLSIKLLFPEKSKGNEMYDKKFVCTFLIETSPIKFSVRRVHKDFYWLRKTLQKLYPGIFIPPIKNKDISESTEEIKVTKIMTQCEHFVNEIVKDDLLRSSKIFYDFITTKNEKEFKIKRQAYEKMEPPKNINDLSTREGKINLDGSIFIQGNRFDKCKTNMNSNIQILNKLNKELKTLVKDITNITNKITTISDLFGDLLLQSQMFPQNDLLIKSYLSAKNLMNNWAYSQRRQATIFDLHIRQYFRYLEREYESIKELYTNYEKRKNEYINYRDKLTKKKEELYKKGDKKKWDLPPEDANIDSNNKELCIEKMLPKESNELDSLMKFACYFGNFFENEFNRIRFQMQDNVVNVFAQFYEQSKKELNEQDAMWEEFRNFKDLEIKIENNINNQNPNMNDNKINNKA